MNEFSFWEKNMTREELLRLSKQSNCNKELAKLSESPYMLVRRAVARNRNTNSATLNKLLFDKVQNVAFAASMHRNCTQTRSFNDEKHPCVICEKDELTMKSQCPSCETLNNYRAYNI